MPEDLPAPAPPPRPALGEQSANHLPVPLPTVSTPRTPVEPMPRKVIATVAALIATATIDLVVVLWWAGTAGLSGAELVNARFNALRTGLSIGVGGGGIFALYLGWRRQHATEIGLVQKERDQADVARAYELQREIAEHTRQHAERVAATTERDTEARRITDLYAKSVEQLGSDRAPVRHGGMYALERLAQDHPDNPALRQTVINVLCAYLRAPFDLPGDSPALDSDRAVRNEHRERVQEREVRLTAQRIITSHLISGDDLDRPAATFWADIDLDLTAAVLIDWSMTGGLLRDATFNRANFIGHAGFNGTRFTGVTGFSDAKFATIAWFSGTRFTDEAKFSRATFTGDAWFSGARFAKDSWFSGATFVKSAWFDEVNFEEDAWFTSAVFTDRAWFTETRFNEDAMFNGAMFVEDAWFNHAVFASDVLFNEDKFSATTRFDEVAFRRLLPMESTEIRPLPPGWRFSPEPVTVEVLGGARRRLLNDE